jgi:TetR/AcrR family transcriptional repressor of mexJK operon
MDAIAERAGVSKATLYSHFADKNDLFRAVMANETQDYEAPSDQVEIADLGVLRSRLLAFGKSVLSILTRPGVLDLGRLLIYESRRHPEQAAHFFASGPEATHLRLATLLATANQNRLVKCEDPSMMADHLLSMWIGQRHLRQQLGLSPPPTSEEIDKHVEACVNVVLKACTP